MTARPRQRARADQRDALAAEVARLRAALDALVVRVVEQAEDIAHIRAAQHARGDGPVEGMVALKVAAEATGYHVESLRRWAASGCIAAVRNGGRWLVDADRAREYAKRLHGSG